MDAVKNTCFGTDRIRSLSEAHYFHFLFLSRCVTLLHISFMCPFSLALLKSLSPDWTMHSTLNRMYVKENTNNTLNALQRTIGPLTS